MAANSLKQCSNFRLCRLFNFNVTNNAAVKKIDGEILDAVPVN